MRDYRAEINDLARQVHREAVERNTQTRPLAQRIMRKVDDPDLLRFMGAELLVLLIENATKRPALIRPSEEPEPARTKRSNAGIPRKGRKARAQWETETDEGRAWAEAMAEIDRAATEELMAGVKAATERFANTLRDQWTSEILDRLFLDADGNAVPWRDATADQHEARAAKLLEAAAEPVREAVLHETAARQIRDAGATTLGELVGASA